MVANVFMADIGVNIPEPVINKHFYFIYERVMVYDNNNHCTRCNSVYFSAAYFLEK